MSERKPITWKVWLKGLVAAAVGGAAACLGGWTGGIDDPGQLAMAALGGAVSGAALYLSKSPIWDF